ncbi:Translation initiation factor IF-2 [bacterium HR29]|jgi:translation initiation factor IF-2|nr:Translation initiation factor IF-2 [bacterium HR29]
MTSRTTSQTKTQPAKTVRIPDALTVKELGDILGVSPIEVIKRLMTHGIMAALNNTIDFRAAELVAKDFGFTAELEQPEIEPVQEEPVLSDEETPDDPSQLVERPPVVTVLGHVDHGKTSLLDAIRKTRVAASEAGGITQHIGAYQVTRNGKTITFIDTPGHAAFTAMRARGARVTDIAVLVVAADDGVMPQTIEAINHAKAANVPIIVAINKVDLPQANPDRVKQQLLEHGVVVEEYGGDSLAVEVSAVKGTGIDDLLEAINLVAELLELKANPNRPASGYVIEAKLDTSRGPVATLLVKNGTLRRGDALVAGEAPGKVRAMFDENGRQVNEAGPSKPVQVMGLEQVPEAGDRFRVVADEKTARQIAEERRREREAREQPAHAHVALDTLFNEISAGKLKELILIVKADVHGSVEAIKTALEGLSTPEVKVRIIHAAPGPVTDSDVMLAEASRGIIIAFNTRIEPTAKKRAEQSGIEIRSFRIIYELIDAVQQALTGMYEPVFETVVDGHAEVRAVFKSSRVGQIAGCYVTDGTIRRGSWVRVLRNGEEIARGRCESLKRFKDDVREVQAGYECGLTIGGFDKFQEGDVLEFYHEERVR